MPARPEIACIVDPRFPGGTSAAVAQELRVAARLGRVTLHCVSSAMFEGAVLAPVLAAVADELGLAPVWDAREIRADLAILHNPSFLKFQPRFGPRIVARELVVVTHENFLRPDGGEGFDIARCLGLIDRASFALRRTLAPVSAYNRGTIGRWARRGGLPKGWRIAARDWFNICEFAPLRPVERPSDRRGRHSRPALEKFPLPEVMDHCFPPHAGANVILGADQIIGTDLARPHWQLFPFGSLPVSAFFDRIDFLVYFTAPTYRESFGRVLAEGVAAGKAVITDADTAGSFHGAVLSAAPGEVDGLIAHLVAAPEIYQERVLAGQERMKSFSADAFRDYLGAVLEELPGETG